MNSIVSKKTITYSCSTTILLPKVCIMFTPLCQTFINRTNCISNFPIFRYSISRKSIYMRIYSSCYYRLQYRGVYYFLFRSFHINYF